MKNYESMLILEPNLPESEVGDFIKGVEGDLVSSGGQVTLQQVEGKRTLAYKIKGQREGIYALIGFSAPADGVKKLEKKFRMAPQVLRYLLVKN